MGFLKEDPFAPRHEHQPGEKVAPGGELVFTVEIRKRPDPGWSLLISEIVHNLHTSLDHMAWAIAGKAGEPPRGTSFPIYPSAKSYRDQWTRQSGYFATRGSPAHAQAIIEDVQPYHRRNHEGHPLWVLRGLANQDKHESPHLMGSSLALAEHELNVSGGVVERPTRPRFFYGPFKDGDVLARWPMPPIAPAGTKMETGIRFGFDIAFGKLSPAKGRPARTVLSEIAEEVDLVFERLLPFLR